MAILETLKISKNSSAQWITLNPILDAMELGVEVDTKFFKIGNGTANWSTLPYVVNGGPNALLNYLSTDPDNLIGRDDDGGIILLNALFNAIDDYNNGKEQGAAAITPAKFYNVTIQNIGKDVKIINALINSLTGRVDNLEAIPAAAQIDDLKQQSNLTWSSSRIADYVITLIAQLKSDITSNSDGAYDALVRLAQLLEDNDSLATVIANQLGTMVSFSDEQTLTSAQASLARKNIGALEATQIEDIENLEAAYTTGVQNFDQSQFFENQR